MPEKKYWTEIEISQVTSVPLKTLRQERYLKKGFPFIKRGRRVYYDMEQVLLTMEAGIVKTVRN
ncbi:MAG: transcriptional regulator [Chloroflexi bacterium HGW-Chloroflexi-5]|jgi:hypothetical protein|nr:MAG: transcriptional regulator [Chloroflexi bacterium HGW-Chloroflexi-5]